jgi:D-arabinose 1-dehydrogenase-like Zn-dependent alcohol dehydrogenase
MDFMEAAPMPWTYGTTYESLIKRLEIRKGENIGFLIINGVGGAGAVASQIGEDVIATPYKVLNRY